MTQSSLAQEILNLEKNIDKLLEDSNNDNEDALRHFLRLWEKIPPEWKTQCKPPPSDRVKVDQWKLDIITVPEIVLAHLKLWENDPLSILTTPATISLNPSQSFASRLYLALDHIEIQSSIVKAIRLRILQIALHSLMIRLNVHQLHTTSEAETEFLGRIEVAKVSAKGVKRIKKWATNGRKYASLSTELGGLGSMICMPQDISTYKLERITQDGDTRKKVIANLKGRGINDQKDKDIQRCYVVAEKIQIAINEELDTYFRYELPPQIQTTLPQDSKKRKRNRKENTGEPERQISKSPSVNPTALVVLGSEAIAAPQHGLVRAATPSQDPEGITQSGKPEAAAACSFKTGNPGINTGGPMTPRALFRSPLATQLNINRTPNQQLRVWNNMNNQFWNDMTDVVPHFWDDMNQVNWEICFENYNCNSHLVNPRSMDNSFPGPTNSSEVLSST